MNTTSKLIIILAAGAVALIGFVGARATGVLQAQPTSVAAVDTSRLFDQLTEKEDFDAELNTARDQLRGEATNKQREAQELQADLDLLAPGTPAYQQKEEELSKKGLENNVWGQFEQAKLNKMAGLRIENLYRKALDTVALIAEESGYDVVIAKEAPPKFQYENLQQLLAKISLRKSLYTSETIDITDQVIQRMNNEYKNVR